MLIELSFAAISAELDLGIVYLAADKLLNAFVILYSSLVWLNVLVMLGLECDFADALNLLSKVDVFLRYCVYLVRTLAKSLAIAVIYHLWPHDT